MRMDIRALAGNLQEVGVYGVFYNTYRIEPLSGVVDLAGFDRVETAERMQFHNPSLLLAFMGLFTGPVPYVHRLIACEPEGSEIRDDILLKAEGFSETDMDMLRASVDQEKLLKFCKKYGMPYDDPNVDIDPIDDHYDRLRMRDDLEYWGPKLREEDAYLAIESWAIYDNLLLRLARLYNCFHLWYEMYTEGRGFFFKKRLKSLEEFRLILPEDDSEAVHLSLSHDVTWMMHGLSVVSIYDPRKNAHSLIMHADNLITASYFLLSNLMTLPKSETKQSLRKCSNPRCGSLFWAEHGRAKYCEFCDRRTVFKQQAASKKAKQV